ncbi:MAG: hypothetical protein PVG39_25590 [Desulfobacteraceae bacterium]|jgi:hypothetical protein
MMNYLYRLHAADAYGVFNSGNPVLNIVFSVQDMRRIIEEETL